MSQLPKYLFVLCFFTCATIFPIGLSDDKRDVQWMPQALIEVNHDTKTIGILYAWSNEHLADPDYRNRLLKIHIENLQAHALLDLGGAAGGIVSVYQTVKKTDAIA